MTPTGLGFVLSGRLRQFSLDPQNPNVIAPGKIPRITPTPHMALKDGKPFMAWTTPGEDVQTQANLQVFFNVVHFGMDLQTAVEVPRFRSLHGPAPQFPQEMLPGQVRAEPRIAPETIKAAGRDGPQDQDGARLGRAERRDGHHRARRQDRRSLRRGRPAAELLRDRVVATSIRHRRGGGP